MLEIDQKDSVIRKYKLQVNSMNTEIKDLRKGNLARDETILNMNVKMNAMKETLESFKQ